MTRFLALARVLTIAAARGAAPVFVPTYFGLGILGVILFFGPNAMRSADLTRAALTEPITKVADALAEAMASTTPLTSEERAARAGLTSRQLTIR